MFTGDPWNPGPGDTAYTLSHALAHAELGTETAPGSGTFGFTRHYLDQGQPRPVLQPLPRGLRRQRRPGVYSIPEHSGAFGQEYAGFNVDWIAQAFDASRVFEYV